MVEKLIDLIAKHSKWTCNDHEKCEICVYFYYSCPGFSNTSDLERQAIPKNERRFIEYVWKTMILKCDISETAKFSIFWSRFKDIGITFDNLKQIRELNVEEIEKLIKKQFRSD